MTDVLTSRLPPLADPESNPIIKEQFDETRARLGRLLNLHLTQAHAPNLSNAQRKVINAIRRETKAPQKLIELGILRAATDCGCDYEFVQHIPLALNAGLTRPQIDAVGAWRESGLFDARERAVLAWVEAIDKTLGKVDDAIYAEMARHFSPQEILEITFTACLYYGSGLMIKALQIKLEPESLAVAASSAVK